MKLESFSDLYFVLAVLVPGFIYRSVLTHFVPLREQANQGDGLLAFVRDTVFMYAICSPLIYAVMSKYTLSSLIAAPGQAIAILFFILYAVPTLFAGAMAYLIQHDTLSKLARKIGLKPIHPIPTGWDWKFGATEPTFMLVTMTDGRVIAGWFGEESMASSDPDRRDLFLEKVYTIPSDGSPWVETAGSSGIYIDGKQIAVIEFRG